jgi:hypothetical protein
MTQQIYVGGRQSGKTTMLVLWYRANPGAKIVVAHEDRKRWLRDIYGIPREDILTYENLRRRTHYIGRSPVGFDDMENFLRLAWFDLIVPIRAEQLGPATFDTEALGEIFHFTPLDPAAMEHINSELRSDIRDEREKRAAERQNYEKVRVFNSEIRSGLPGREG